MSATNIKHAGLIQFAQNGYDGTSLASIANDVGIKKQSIYAHFANKDELYLTILEDVIKDEKQYIQDYLSSHSTLSLHDKLFQFLTNYGNRYETHASMKFLLRNGFLPPTHLHEQMMKKVYHFYDEIELLFLQYLEKHQTIFTEAVGEVVISFIGLIDSIQIELLYSGTDRFQRRLNACWKIFWRGISVQKEEINENE
ncbi:MAG TPA: TetR/AcrR family transcriptional regulator [Metabacillus sp.]|nr:TetR/AcrR family transcriptional regulator [Metabacillus sp.]